MMKARLLMAKVSQVSGSKSNLTKLAKVIVEVFPTKSPPAYFDVFSARFTL